MAPYVVFRCLNCKKILKSVKSLENHEKFTHGIFELTHEDYELIWSKPSKPKVTNDAESSNVASEAPVGVNTGRDAGDHCAVNADGAGGYPEIVTLDLPPSGLVYLPGPSKGLHSLQPPQQPPPTSGHIQHRNDVAKDVIGGEAGSSTVNNGGTPSEATPSAAPQTIRKKAKFKAPLRSNNNSEKIGEVSPEVKAPGKRKKS